MNNRTSLLLGVTLLAAAVSYAGGSTSNRARTSAAPAQAMTVPAGTHIPVRMIDPIDGNTAAPGSRYRASVDEPVLVGSQVAIPRGANCTVEVVNVESGKGMALRLRNVDVRGKVYGTSTEYSNIAAQGTSRKKKALRRGVGGGAVGAGVGALVGGGTGAAVGGALGGGVGVGTAAASKGKQLNVPSETRLIFALKAPLPMK